jgi:SAM-dependent methyltransferase
MNPTELQKLYADRSAREGYEGDNFSPRIKKVHALLEEYEDDCMILDVGCATGATLAKFTERHRILGVDIGREFLDKAKDNGYKYTDIVDVSTQHLPFQDGTFDIVFCGECIEHIVDTDWLLCEINRVLKEDSDLILTFPNVRTPVSLAMMLANHPPMYSARYRAGHVRDFTTKTMKIALENAGFWIEDMIGSDFYVPGLASVGSAIATHLPSWSSSVVERANKSKDKKYSIEEVETTRMA